MPIAPKLIPVATSGRGPVRGSNTMFAQVEAVTMPAVNGGKLTPAMMGLDPLTSCR